MKIGQLPWVNTIISTAELCSGEYPLGNLVKSWGEAWLWGSSEEMRCSFWFSRFDSERAAGSSSILSTNLDVAASFLRKRNSDNLNPAFCKISDILIPLWLRSSYFLFFLFIFFLQKTGPGQKKLTWNHFPIEWVLQRWSCAVLWFVYPVYWHSLRIPWYSLLSVLVFIPRCLKKVFRSVNRMLVQYYSLPSWFKL